MAGTLEGCLTLAMRSVADAQTLDLEKKAKEAYCNYLGCTVYISSVLKDDAWDRDLSSCNTMETIKLFSLMKQCLDRSLTLLKEEGDKKRFTPTVPQQQPYSLYQSVQTDPRYSVQVPQVQRRQTWVPPSQSKSVHQIYRDVHGSPKMDRRGNYQPLEHAHQANQQVLTAYRKRVARSSLNNRQLTSKNLSMLRKISENISIAKAHEYAIAYRRQQNLQRLSQEVDRRFSSSSSAENKQLLTSVLEFEQETKWPRDSLSTRLKAFPDDSATISYAITMILRSEGHPLTQILAQYQNEIQREIRILLQEPSPGEVQLDQVYVLANQQVPFVHSQDLAVNENSDNKLPNSEIDIGEEKPELRLDSNIDIGAQVGGRPEDTDTTKQTAISPTDPVTVNEDDFDDDLFDEFLDSENSESDNENDSINQINEQNLSDSKTEKDQQTIITFVDGEVESKTFDTSTVSENEMTYNESSTNDDIKKEDCDEISNESPETELNEDKDNIEESNICSEEDSATRFEQNLDDNTSRESASRDISQDEKRLDTESEKSKSDNEPEKCKSDNEPEKCKSDNESEKSKSDDESEKSKSDTEPEKNKSDDESEKSKSDTEPEKSKSDDESEKSKSDTESEKSKSDTESEKSKFGSKSEMTKSDNESGKSKSDAEPGKSKSDTESGKSKSDAESGKSKSDAESEKSKSDTESEKSKSDTEPEKSKSDTESEKSKSDTEPEKSKSDNESEKSKPCKYYCLPDLTEAVKIQDSLRKKMKKITSDIRFYIEKLQSLFIVVYEELDTPAGKDQSYATIELAFFTNLWPEMLSLFKRVNYSHEVILAHVITNHIRDIPEDMDICKRLCLTDQEFSDNDYPYKMAVEELYKVVSYVSPLEKLDCIVRTSRAICQCVQDYCEMKGHGKQSSLAAIGCDDLLPIFGYVVVKSGLPQIVSECNAIEEFIPEGVLMGEEGYCLTTLQTVLSYLSTLDTKIKQ